uniref:Uncharacterized protein n=1 Tax=Phlebotomus papatasi TaxID=29031 RepID=A0A1B0D0K9_PHLPP
MEIIATLASSPSTPQCRDSHVTSSEATNPRVLWRKLLGELFSDSTRNSLKRHTLLRTSTLSRKEKFLVLVCFSKQIKK